MAEEKTVDIVAVEPLYVGPPEAQTRIETGRKVAVSAAEAAEFIKNKVAVKAGDDTGDSFQTVEDQPVPSSDPSKVYEGLPTLPTLDEPAVVEPQPKPSARK